jgi:hypothetical protein
MQRRQFLLILSVMLALSACTDRTGPAGKIWFFTHSTGSTEPSNSGLNPANFIDLEADGRYTRDFGHFDYGKWKYSNRQLIFTSYRDSQSVMPINYLTATEMQVGPPAGPFDNFESQSLHATTAAENPFSKENNRWRIKAAEKETAVLLKNRLLNHFRFWEMYFTWALNNHIDYIDVRSTPTPIKIYGNGFGLKPFSQLPDAWKMYFYDEEDCRAANDQIQYVFSKNLLAWPQTDNKYKMFIGAFQQLQRKLP